MEKILLIGGAPGTGKTTAARELAKKLDILWISTDQIRSILKSVAGEETLVFLSSHAHTGANAQG